MTEKHLSLSEAQQQLSTLPQLFAQTEDPIIVTQDEQQVMAILSMANYLHMCETIEALNQTLEILHNEKFMTSFRLAQRGTKAEALIPLEQIRREFGWEDEKQEPT
ncbi:hypothetical protein KDA_15190 [Dictyobacter alpinus]|uniref:Antitoxin n=1 Tax=Dictyobacter alpinus TaxID=2014873 RepID=A0A402B3V6_9CHLR|nr:hypothetical protein [Dictyobacter alpinus]GCE26035.1 hypothetical protein KDA_15190 [Dictyobacter alpinus]